jgi:DNA polymerase-1
MANVVEKLLIVDGNHLLHRVLFTPKLIQLETLSGKKFGGVFGFLKCLRRSLDDEIISNCVVAWDDGLSKRRLELFPGYKGTRRLKEGEEEDPKMVEHRKLFGLSRDYLEVILPLLCVPSLRFRGREGDDVIWSVRDQWREIGKLDAGVISEDKDFCQMVDERTYLYRPIQNLRLTINNFEEQVGVPRSRFLLYKALVGDKSDNISGVPGVGDATAREIVMRAPGKALDWDEITTFCASHKKTRVRRVAEQLDVVKRNLKLVRLGLEILEPEEDERIRVALSKRTSGDLGEVQSLFSAMEFESLSRGFYDWSIPFVRLGAR